MRSPAACPLSSTQLAVLQALADGGTDHTIAAAAATSENTIRARIWRATERLGVQTRLDAILACAREGWIVVDGLTPAAPVTPIQNSILADFDRHLKRTRGRAGRERDWMDALVDDMRRFGA